jgi:hypothetical protein
MHTQLTADDEAEILALVKALPDIDHRVVSFARYSNGEVCVMTGELTGPRSGGGDNIWVEKVGGNWRVKRVTFWMA